MFCAQCVGQKKMRPALGALLFLAMAGMVVAHATTHSLFYPLPYMTCIDFPNGTCASRSNAVRYMRQLENENAVLQKRLSDCGHADLYLFKEKVLALEDTNSILRFFNTELERKREDMRSAWYKCSVEKEGLERRKSDEASDLAVDIKVHVQKIRDAWSATAAAQDELQAINNGSYVEKLRRARDIDLQTCQKERQNATDRVFFYQFAIALIVVVWGFSR